MLDAALVLGRDALLGIAVLALLTVALYVVVEVAEDIVAGSVSLPGARNWAFVRWGDNHRTLFEQRGWLDHASRHHLVRGWYLVTLDRDAMNAGRRARRG